MRFNKFKIKLKWSLEVAHNILWRHRQATRAAVKVSYKIFDAEASSSIEEEEASEWATN